MSHDYRTIGWNRQKVVYDRILVSGVFAYLGLFIVLGLALRPNITIETLLLRAFGTGALLLLHVVLSIGPLCRLDPRFLPLLYNRRHLGVTLFVLAAVHGVLATIQFHALGDVNPLVSILAGNDQFGTVGEFPFQPLGLAALLILFLMAATSHDFWLANLTAPVWKSLHMMVYLAYGLLIAHVVLGVLQSETDPALAVLLGLGVVWILGLHLVSAWIDRDGPDLAASGAHWIDVGLAATIPENRARQVLLAGERVAVFRYHGKVTAVSGVCQHQNGPLGEGCIIDGLITCPWHGYQYDPASGASPPPFGEKIPTFNVKVERGRVWLDPRPNPPGTVTRPALIDDDIADD